MCVRARACEDVYVRLCVAVCVCFCVAAPSLAGRCWCPLLEYVCVWVSSSVCLRVAGLFYSALLASMPEGCVY